MQDLKVIDSLPAKQETDIDSLVGTFLASLDVKESSKETYRRTIAPFTTWLKEKAIQSITREDLLEYKTYLSGLGLSSLTVSSYITAVRKFFAWAESVKLYPDIAKGIKGMKRSRQFKKDPLTIDQIKNLLGAMNRNTLQGKRDYAILNLMVRTGLRTIEIIRADIKDISQKGGEAILWIQGKGKDDKDEFILLTSETLNPINEYLGARADWEDPSPLFVSTSNKNKGGRLTTRSISRTVKEYLRGIGIDNNKLTAHSLRHTAVTLSLLGGATIQEAQSLARHTDINTTMIYAHNIDRTGQEAPERKIDEYLKIAV